MLNQAVQYEKVRAKTLLSKRMDGDSWFHSNHSMNIYRGCQFACAYCDGMSEYYHVDNYTTHIRVKENAPELLRKELKKLGYVEQPRSLLDFTDSSGAERRKPIIGVSGGVSDSYQQAEKEYKVTRKVLEVLLEYRLPVFLLTKSDLVLRDIELLKEINEAAHANVSFSVAFSDEETKSKIEPYSASIAERLDALKLLRNEGIHGGVMGLPIVPYIGDSLDSMRNLVRMVRDAKAEYIILGGMTLKPGRQKNYFYGVVKRHFSDKLAGIRALYSDDNRYGVPKSNGPLNPFILGPGICEDEGLRWTSIRHGASDEYPVNTMTLAALLEYTFISSTLLREPKQTWNPFRELAIKIEHGLPPVQKMIHDAPLLERYKIDENILPELESIIKTGTSPKLIQAKQKALRNSRRALESLSKENTTL